MRLVLLLAALGTAACSGGGSTSSSSPAGPSGPSTPSTATITITPAGVSPKTVTITAGGQVTFVNNDTQSHDMQSDPHPEHDDCPEIGQVGFLTPGQSRATGNLNTPRTCGFHDHDDFANSHLWGNIVIQ